MVLRWLKESLSGEEGDLYDLSGIVDGEGKLTKESIDAATTLLEGKRQLARDRRRVLVAACVSYRRSAMAYEACVKFQNKGDILVTQSKSLEDNPKGSNDDSEELALLNLLRQRQGDASNELGKFLLQELRDLLGKGKKDGFTAAEALLASAQYWFGKGLEAFESSSDIRNSALLRCNLCQCHKLRANANFAPSQSKSQGTKSDKSAHADACLKEAIHHLQAAHERIGQRDVDPGTWDMVSRRNVFRHSGVDRYHKFCLVLPSYAFCKLCS